LLGNRAEMRIKLIRNFVLMAIGERFPRIKKNEYVVIKEPNGPVGAPLMVEALLESRVIFLIRDPRDVVSSSLLSSKAEGGWFREQWERKGRKGSGPPRNPEKIVRTGARKYLWRVGRSKEAHEGRKVLVKYEDLRADAPGEMKRIYSTLDIPASEEEIARAVEKHSWEKLPEEKKGSGNATARPLPEGSGKT